MGTSTKCFVACGFLSVVGLGIVAVAFSSLKQQWTSGVLEVAGATSFAFLVFRFTPVVKKRSLLVDRLAADVVGRESFLHVLQKIDAMGLRDVERLKAGGWRRRFKPSITERIENLRPVSNAT